MFVKRPADLSVKCYLWYTALLSMLLQWLFTSIIVSFQSLNLPYPNCLSLGLSLVTLHRYLRLDNEKTGLVPLSAIFESFKYKRNLYTDCLLELLEIEHGKIIRPCFQFYL